MPGAYELRLISRYFGGVRAHWASMDVIPGAATEVFTAVDGGSAKHHQNTHHLHLAHKVNSRPSYKHGASDEDIMQVLFKKLSSTQFQGPTRQGAPGDEHSQPGH